MKRWVYTLLPLLVLMSLIVWRIDQKRAEDNAQIGMRLARKNATPAVSVVPAQFRNITRTFEATGSIDAPLDVKIASKITGRVVFLQLHEGDPVKKGQVLARIDASQVEAEVRQSRAALAEAEYRLAQAELTQNPTNVSVITQLRQQKAGASSAVAGYNQTSANYQAQVATAAAGVTSAQSQVNNAKAAISSAQANLNDAKAKYTRTLDLYKQGFIAAQDVDDAKAALAVQEAALEVARGQLQSANAQKQSAEEQLSIVRTKGKADIEAAKAAMIQAKASVQYAKANTAQTAAYKQSIAALKASVDSAKAQLAASIANRADTVLVSPLDGFVTGRYVDPGAVVTPGQQILSVEFMRQVWVTAGVPEEVCTKIHIGQTAQVRLDAYPGQTFTGNIIQINPAADTQSRQFAIRLVMNNEQNLFKPGMFAHVTFETERIPDVISVPKEAVKQSKIGAFVYVVDAAKQIHLQPVTVGASDAAWSSVTGLKPGDKVVTMCSVPLKDGQKISLGGQHNRSGKRGRA